MLLYAFKPKNALTTINPKKFKKSPIYIYRYSYQKRITHSCIIFSMGLDITISAWLINCGPSCLYAKCYRRSKIFRKGRNYAYYLQCACARSAAMSFFFQTVAGILRGSVHDTTDDRDYCCHNHYCHHQTDEPTIRAERRVSLKPQHSVVSVASSSETSSHATTDWHPEPISE